jgi:hypothetical protein
MRKIQAVTKFPFFWRVSDSRFYSRLRKTDNGYEFLTVKINNVSLGDFSEKFKENDGPE